MINHLISFLLIFTLIGCGGSGDSDLPESEKFTQSIPFDTTLCATDVNEDQFYACTDPLSASTFSFLSDATTCTWIEADLASSTFSGTPTAEDIGTCDLVISFLDLFGTTTETVTITVNNVQPSLSIANTSLAQGSAETVIKTDADVEASDEGFGVYSLDNASALVPRCSDFGGLVINEDNGEITFDPDDSFGGSCNVAVLFDDQEAVDNSVIANFIVNIIGTNNPPVITNNCDTLGEQDRSYDCVFNFNDIDGDTVALSINPSNTCTWITFSPLTGVLSATPNDSQVGNCSLMIDANDGVNPTVTTTIPVIVLNRIPSLAINDTSANNNGSFVIRNDGDVQSNEEGDGLYSFNNATTPGIRCSDFGTLAIDSTTGEITYTTTGAFTGFCNVKVRFDDQNPSFNIIETVFSVEVLERPQPPENLSTAEAFASLTESPPIIWEAANTPPAFDSYEVALGSAPGLEDLVPFTNIGNVLTHTFTGLSLTECTPVYASVRTFSATLGVSTTETVSFFGDITPPSDPSALVLAGDRFFIDGDANTLDWSASTDNCTPPAEYETAISTDGTSDDVISLTNVGNVLTHQFEGESSGTFDVLTDYQNLVRSIDLAGNTSATVASAIWQFPEFALSRPIAIAPATPFDDFTLEVELDLSNFDYSDVQADCDDFRFETTTGVRLEYLLSDCDTSGESLFLVRVPTASTASIVILYANPDSVSESTPNALSSTFPEDRYVRISSRTASTTLNIFSYVDSNEYSVQTTTTPSTGTLAQFAGATIAATTQAVIQSTGPLSGRANVNSNDHDTIMPISWATTIAGFALSRTNTDVYDFYNPNTTDANVVISNFNGAGTLLGTQAVTVPAEGFASQAFDTNAAIMESDIPVVSFVSGTANRSDGVTLNFTCDRGDRVLTGGTGTQLSGAGFLLSSNFPISGMSQADSDGSESTSFIPRKFLRNEYIIPTQSQYIAVLCEESGDVDLFDETGALDSTETCTSPGGGAPGMVFFGTVANVTNHVAGFRVRSSSKLFVAYENFTSQETNTIAIEDGTLYSETLILETVGSEVQN